MKNNKKKKSNDDIVIDGSGRSYVFLEETLPYPYVHYPGITGPFIGFSETENSPILFCECFRKTFENYIRLFHLYEQRHGRIRYSPYYLEYIFNSRKFPHEFTKYLVDEEIPESEVMNHVIFKKKICHKCNHVMPLPTLNFCNMSNFERHYGWYVKKKQIDLGYTSCDCILDSCPEEIKDLLSKISHYSMLFQEEIKKWHNHQANYELASQYDKRTQKEARKLHKIVENYVREDFGYKKIGEHWVTETMLFHIVSQIFPDYKVIFHYRPPILEGLEIDIFISEINLGIEYQGIQHFKPIDFWGGEEALKKTQQHDEKKKSLCQQLGIGLIYFYFYDNINESLVKERLKEYLNR